jgi:hypothetical protein
MAVELFELDLLGGAAERLYRRNRPGIDALPWGTLATPKISEAHQIAARREWTDAAMQEYTSAANLSLTLRALLRARVPLDLSGALAQFPLDEVAHAELCARVAGELGGGTPIRYDPVQVFPLPDDGEESVDPIVAATERVVREFCVGESVSHELLKACSRAARQPLLREVLRQLVKDENRHAAFGWLFLDWAAPQLDTRSQARVRRSARLAVTKIDRIIRSLDSAPREVISPVGMIGAMGRDAYVACGRRAIEVGVLERLDRFGLAPA